MLALLPISGKKNSFRYAFANGVEGEDRAKFPFPFIKRVRKILNFRCSKPDIFAGKSLFNITREMACEQHGTKSAIALAVAIPIIIICCLLIGYYVYKIIKNRKHGQHKSVRYSAVYKDTVESTKHRPDM